MNQRKQGILYIVLAAFFFSLMTFFVRLSGDLPTMQKAFFRNAVAMVAAFFMLAKSEEGFRVKKSSWLDLFLRAFFGTSGLICNFYAIDRLPISDANMLNKLSPFFAMIMSVFILKEKASKFQWGAILMAMIGAMFVVHPSFNVSCIPALIGLCGGLGAGIAYTFVRKLGTKGERGPVIVMAFSTFSVLVTLPFIIIGYEPMTLKQLLFLLLAGVSATGGQLTITAAYTKAPAREISVYDYTQVLFAALLGIIFLNQLPDLLSVIGYIIIIGTAIVRWKVENK